MSDSNIKVFRFYINCNDWSPTREQWLYGTRCITKSELTRIDKFVFQRDAKFALAGQLLIRYLLSRAFRRASSSFEVKRTERGRPFIESTPKFDFNLSHHNQLVCIAGTFDGLLGCDTMEYRISSNPRESIESLTNLLRGEFTKNEYDFILNRSQDERKRFAHFHRLWCLKESYVKWLGYGIGFKLSRLNFCINTEEFNVDDPKQVITDTKLEIDNKLITENLRFEEQVIYLADNEQQLITLCLSDTNKCEPFVELTMEEILEGCTPLDENEYDEETWWIRFKGKPAK